MKAWLIAALCAVAQLPVGASAAETTPTVDARIVVSFTSTVRSTATLESVLDGTGLGSMTAVSPRIRGYAIEEASSWGEVYEAMIDLRRVPGVEEVVLRPMVRAAGFDDPGIPDMWGLGEYPGIEVDGAWSYADGTGVTVAVIDSGGTTHTDLDANTISGYDFVTDDIGDGDGWDNDPSDPGDWCDEPPSNSSWHGTHVAGTIAAVAGNDEGIAGVAPKSKVLHARALGVCGVGGLDDVAAAMRWAAGLSVPGVPTNPNPAKVINMSLSGPGSCPAFMQTAIDDTIAAGALVVVAAGNNNSDASARTPANCNNVIAVAAVNSSGNKASFSNYGSVVDIAAPGVVILSTVNDGLTVPTTPGYKLYSGTSMATPHVAGVAALMLSARPTLTVTQLRNAVLDSASSFAPGSTCTTLLCGRGLVNAAAAVGTSGAVIVPGAPTAVTASQQSGGKVRVQWSAPAPNGSGAVTNYRITGGDGCTTDTTSCDITGVEVGIPTTFTVKARNSRGLGAGATSNAVTVVLPPTAPRDLVVTQDQLEVLLQWQAPLSNNGGAVTGYRVESVSGKGCTSITTSCTVENLIPGTSYVFNVYADNVGGASPALTSGTITTASGPPAPVDVAAVFGQTTMAVTWEEGTGGLTTTDFLVTVSPGNKQCTTDGLRCDFTGLSPSTSYTVTVRANGPAGTSSASVTVVGTTAAAPTTTTVAPPTTTTLPVASPTTVAVTTTVPNVTTTAPTTTLKKGKRVRVTTLFKIPGGARLAWRTTGGCRVSGGYLIAPTKVTRCTVTMRATKSGKTTSTSRTVRVV